MRELLYLKILYIIRENNNCISLKKLVHKANIYIGYSHNSAHYFLINLCNEGYIIFMDETKNDISNSLCSMDDDKLLDFFYSYFRSDDKDIYVRLTNKLYEIQSLLGFSLKDTITKFGSYYSMMVTPIWHHPNSTLKTDVFVIMPFDDQFNFIYKNNIKKICKRNNLSCKRADDLYSSKPIMEDIWSLIYYSKIIIADCTNKNPNVMYELGIAHTIGKKVILATQNIDDIPFDLRHLRHIHYQYAPHSIASFEDNLNLAIQESLSNNPDDVF